MRNDDDGPRYKEIVEVLRDEGIEEVKAPKAMIPRRQATRAGKGVRSRSSSQNASSRTFLVRCANALIEPQRT